MSRTFTQDEFDAAVAEAVKPLQEELKTFKAQASQSEVETRIAEMESSLKELQSKLDAAVLEAEKAKQDKEDILAKQEADRVAAEAATALAARRDERLAKVSAVATFPDEYLQSNADRFAAMSDEDFEAAIEDWKTIGAKKVETEEAVELPRQTAMVASREDDKSSSAVRELFDMKLRGVDPRRV